MVSKLQKNEETGRNKQTAYIFCFLSVMLYLYVPFLLAQNKGLNTDTLFVYGTVDSSSTSTVVLRICQSLLASAAATAAYASQLSVQLKGPELTAPGCKYANMG